MQCRCGFWGDEEEGSGEDVFRGGVRGEGDVDLGEGGGHFWGDRGKEGKGKGRNYVITIE